jgi:hypothetical protein
MRLVARRESTFSIRSTFAMEERTLVIRRLSTGSVFRVVAAGAFFSLIPLALFFGILALFGLNTVKWNNQPIYGVSGLLVSPLIGLILAVFFTAFGGLALAFGLWLYSKFRPLRLRLIEDSSASAAA